MAESRSVRVGVVGLGQMGRYHTQAYRAAGATLIGVADADPSRRQAFAREFGVPAFASLDELIAADGLDAVSICTPPYLHRPMVQTAVEAGLDVLCEKPLAGTLADGRALAGRLRPDRLFMLCFFHRFHEPLVRLRVLLASGVLGEPRALRNRFALDMAADARPWVWDRALAGGGAVLNTSVHSIDLFRFLVGEPERVVARLRPAPSDGQLERDALLLLEGPRGGPTAVLEAASDAVRKEYSLSLETSEALVEVGWTPPSLRVLRRGAMDWEDIPIEATGALDRIQGGVGHFLACVRDRSEPRAAVADGVRALEVAQAAYLSAERGCFVECGPGRVDGRPYPAKAW